MISLSMNPYLVSNSNDTPGHQFWFCALMRMVSLCHYEVTMSKLGLTTPTWQNVIVRRLRPYMITELKLNGYILPDYLSGELYQCITQFVLDYDQI